MRIFEQVSVQPTEFMRSCSVQFCSSEGMTQIHRYAQSDSGPSGYKAEDEASESMNDAEDIHDFELSQSCFTTGKCVVGVTQCSLQHFWKDFCELIAHKHNERNCTAVCEDSSIQMCCFHRNVVWNRLHCNIIAQ
ncbi:unnamed protein product [Albugo candida]|uniref:Uncharacterized protein n=1 Tax=Albugo candida TaxID=65357 RepID=A0A024GFY9_9STRA|nr:unnamed protein product [Albugo candida]|eukprot:CCI45683.1 unnamed protein product [Albugo candida]